MLAFLLAVVHRCRGIVWQSPTPILAKHMSPPEVDAATRCDSSAPLRNTGTAPSNRTPPAPSSERRQRSILLLNPGHRGTDQTPEGVATCPGRRHPSRLGFARVRGARTRKRQGKISDQPQGPARNNGPADLDKSSPANSSLPSAKSSTKPMSLHKPSLHRPKPSHTRLTRPGVRPVKPSRAEPAARGYQRFNQAPSARGRSPLPSRQAMPSYPPPRQAAAASRFWAANPATPLLRCRGNRNHHTASRSPPGQNQSFSHRRGRPMARAALANPALFHAAPAPPPHHPPPHPPPQQKTKNNKKKKKKKKKKKTKGGGVGLLFSWCVVWCFCVFVLWGLKTSRVSRTKKIKLPA